MNLSTPKHLANRKSKGTELLNGPYNSKDQYLIPDELK